MTGMKTIRQVERVAVRSKSGRVRFVDGPCRLWLFQEQVVPLRRYSAHPRPQLHLHDQ